MFDKKCKKNAMRWDLRSQTPIGLWRLGTLPPDLQHLTVKCWLYMI